MSTFKGFDLYKAICDRVRRPLEHLELEIYKSSIGDNPLPYEEIDRELLRIIDELRVVIHDYIIEQN